MELVGVAVHPQYLQGRVRAEPDVGPVVRLDRRAAPFGYPQFVPLDEGHIDRGGRPFPRFGDLHLDVPLDETDPARPEGLRPGIRREQQQRSDDGYQSETLRPCPHSSLRSPEWRPGRPDLFATFHSWYPGLPTIDGDSP
jgi:hypothetical protein